jgi:hypothetical protein
MKKIIVVVSALVVITAANVDAMDANGSAFGNFSTAKTIGHGQGAFGLGVGIADATSFVGWFNYGLSLYTDGRLKLGLIDYDGDNTEITLGGDFKYQFWSVGGATGNSLDMALGGFFEYVDYGHSSVFQLGGQLLGSYPIILRNNTTLSPYGRFNVRLENYKSGSELEFGLNGGAAWEITPTVTAYGEFQIDGNDGIFLGVDFKVL